MGVRIGEKVLVEWGGHLHPAVVIERPLDHQDGKNVVSVRFDPALPNIQGGEDKFVTVSINRLTLSQA